MTTTTAPHRARSAAFFDLDKTVIAKSSTLAFGRTFYASGLIDRRAALKSAYAQLLFSLAGADHQQMDRIRDATAALCRGWDAGQVRQVVDETLHELIDPLVYDEAVALIEEHHRAGREVVIVSTSGTEVVGPIAARLGADRFVATRMEIEDGRYTGKIAYYCYGPSKASAIRDAAVAGGYDLADCYAYSDSITDVPMLEAVGHPTAVNPDRALRKVAAERGWPVLDFHRPVRLRVRIPAPARPVAAGVGVGIVAGAAVGTAYLLRRRRPA